MLSRRSSSSSRSNRSSRYTIVLNLLNELNGLDFDRGLDIQILHGQRMFFDELAPGLHFVTHQRRENIVGFDSVFNTHLQEHASLGVHGRFPEMLVVHLPETFVALDVLTLLATFKNIVCKFRKRTQLRFLFAVLYRIRWRPRAHEFAEKPLELFILDTGQQLAVDHGMQPGAVGARGTNKLEAVMFRIFFE